MVGIRWDSPVVDSGGLKTMVFSENSHGRADVSRLVEPCHITASQWIVKDVKVEHRVAFIKNK